MREKENLTLLGNQQNNYETEQEGQIQRRRKEEKI